MSYHLLVIEDEAILRRALVAFLQKQHYHVSSACSIEDALSHNELIKFDLILSDLKLPTDAGTHIIPLAGAIPVIIMTGYASVRSAVESIQLGAADYIAKPFSFDDLNKMIQRHLPSQSTVTSHENTQHYLNELHGLCPAMREIRMLIDKLAITDTTVLIVGESGTGKELLARALHEQGQRKQSAFVTINCAAIANGVMETELFGKEAGMGFHKGLIEAADGGTLFLDEIGELPWSAQAYFLQLLQQHEIRRVGAVQARKIDIRIIAATHVDLKGLVQTGKFREDLFYRLNVMEIKLPPLRERGDDILLLAQSLLKKLGSGHHKECHFSVSAEQALYRYAWPGNIRELENSILRAIILSETDEITEKQLGLVAKSNLSESKEDSLSLEGYFRQFVLAHEHDMTEKEIAEALGISRKSLWEKRQRLGICRPRKQRLDVCEV